MNQASKNENLINKISEGSYSEKELINLHSNGIRLGHQDVVDTIELQMRKQYPRAASKKYGAKGNVAQTKLEAAYKEISEAFDLSKNRNNNGVKVGGGIMSGESYIDYYISYKNEDGFGTFLGLIQETVDSELKVRVGLYKTGKDKFDEDIYFVLDDFLKAVDLYKDHLSKVSST
jgi:hypothetical protein